MARGKLITNLKKLAPAAILSLSLNGLMALIGTYKYSYDAYTHIFFADHYRRNWFSLWEPRWYRGFLITTYPPLTHQLLALISFAVGIETSFPVMILITGLLLAIGAYRLSGAFIDDKYRKYVALIVASYPSVGLMLHSYGQLPTVFSTALGTLALASYNDYLETSSRKDLILTMLLTSLTAYSHQLTVYFYVPFVALAIMLSKYERKNIKELFKKTVKLALLTLPVMLIPLIPYFASFRLLTSQEIIPHGSRENIFGNFIFSIMFFWGLYSFTITFLPNAIIIAFRERRTRPLLAAMLFFMILGLGGTTPLPKIILGKYWEILTYERFTFIATILYSFFLAIMLGDAGNIIDKYYLGIENPKPKPRVKRVIITAFMAAMVISYILASGMISSLKLHPRLAFDNALEDIAKFLDKDPEYYYITLELKSQRIRLNLLTSAPTLDGGYNSARQDPLLAESGVENIDASKHFPNGTKLLKILLSTAPEIGLKYVVCADEYYNPILLDYGFKPVKKYNSSPEITIWMLESVKTKVLQKPPPMPKYYVILWCVLPVSILILTTILYFKWRIIDEREN